ELQCDRHHADRLGLADLHLHRLHQRHGELGVEDPRLRQRHVADHQAREHGRTHVQLIRSTLFGLTLAFAAAAAEPGPPAPGFTAKTFEGKQVSLADYRGKVVFVDFWASWCSPCRESLPLYDKLAADFGGDEFTVIAVNLDETAADAKKFMAEHPVKYTV